MKKSRFKQLLERARARAKVSRMSLAEINREIATVRRLREKAPNGA